MKTKVLLLRFSSIGDILLTTPVIRGLKKQLGAEVHVLCKAAFKPVLEANPYVDELHTFEKKLGEVLPALRREGFDLVIDLHKNLRSSRVKWQLRRPSFSFQKLNLEKWLLVNLKWNLLPDRHIVDRYLDTVRHLGVINDEQGLDYFIPPGEEVEPHLLFREKGEPESGPGFGYLAVVVAAAHPTKRPTAEQYIELCRQLREPVALMGGPAEAGLGERIAREAGEGTANFCGALSLHHSASLIRQARLVITPDTGLMHIAAAFGKEIISLWGNTVPEFGMYPYFGRKGGRNHTLQVSDLDCRPCSKIGFEQCPKGHFRCMKDLPLQRIRSLAQGD